MASSSRHHKLLLPALPQLLHGAIAFTQLPVATEQALADGQQQCLLPSPSLLDGEPRWRAGVGRRPAAVPPRRGGRHLRLLTPRRRAAAARGARRQLRPACRHAALRRRREEAGRGAGSHPSKTCTLGPCCTLRARGVLRPRPPASPRTPPGRYSVRFAASTGRKLPSPAALARRPLRSPQADAARALAAGGGADAPAAAASWWRTREASLIALGLAAPSLLRAGRAHAKRGDAAPPPPVTAERLDRAVPVSDIS